MSMSIFYNEKTDNIKITSDKVTYIEDGKVVTKEFKLDYDVLIEELKNIFYSDVYKSIGGKNAFNSLLEYMSMPTACKLFYKMYCTNLKIVQPQELIDAYLSEFCIVKSNTDIVLKKEYINDSNFILHFSYNDVAGRILRSYCSLCRELLLLAFLCKKYPEYNAYYSYYEDVVNGRDIMLKHGNKRHVLATYVDTDNSKKHRKHKINSFYSGEKLNIVEMPANLNKNTKFIGDIAIYDEEYIISVVHNL